MSPDKPESLRIAQCHDCQLKAGAKEPKHGLSGVTCSYGECPGCGSDKTFLMYPSDYDWPDSKAVWD